MKIHYLLFLLLPCLALAVVHQNHMSTENRLRATVESRMNKTATETDTDTSLPGLSEYFGASYDIFTGNPISNMIDPGFKPKNLFKWSSTLKTTQDQKFTYPQDITVKELQSCSRIAESEMYTGLKGYHESLEQNVEAEAGYDGLVASVSFTASVGYKTAQTEISTQNKVRVTTQEKCLLYEAGIPSKPTLSEDFKNAIEIARVTNGWAQFLKDWGTHYAKQLVLGASAIRETIFDKTTVQNLQAVGVDVEVGVSGSYGSYHGSVSSSTKLTKEQQSYFEQAKSTFREFYIGVEPSDGSTASQWALKLQGVTPLPISFSLGYIGDVIYTQGIDNFGGKYSASQLESMKNSFDAAVKKLANTLTPVPSSDPALASVNILTAHTLTYGGYGGSEFEDREILNNPLMRLQAIEINSGSRVDGLRFKLNDGVRDQWTDWHGGSGGSKQTLTIPSGRRVAKVEIWNGNEVDGLRFIYDDDTYSSVYGSSNGNYNVVTIYGYLTGMKGRSGSRLDAVAFISNEYSYDPTNPKSVIYATPRYGGDGGSPFQDYQPANTAAQPSSLDVRWSKDGVKGIRLVLKEGSSTYGNNYGSTSNTLSSLSLAGLKTINVWSGSRVDAIQVVTSAGTSAKVGGGGGGQRTINVPAGATLIGLYGRTGSAVDAIGFVFSKRG